MNGYMLDISNIGVRPARGTVQAGYWRGFKELVYHLGGSQEKILERHGIDPQRFEFHDYHVDCGSVLEMLEYCSSQFDDPLFGLRLADRQTPDVFGGVAVLSAAAPTFGEALKCLVRFVPVANSPEGMMELVQISPTAELRWSSDIVGSSGEQSHFHGLLLIMKTLRSLSAGTFTPHSVSLSSHAGWALRDEIEQRAACKLVTRAPANAITFSAAILDKPNPLRNDMVYRLLSRYLSHMADTPSQSIVDEVAYFIATNLAGGHCTIERCAARLGTSTRMLQKALASRETSFSGLLEQHRDKLARQALLQSISSIDEIAYDLGYAEQSSFGRAFKRWTGQSPKSFRRMGLMPISA